MSPDDTPPAKPADNDNNQQGSGGVGGGGRKTTSSSTTTRPQQEQNLKCPRCDSPNTKFCYYNNYSLTQPRHFCKTCRRYWTKGGALRNVPIGGGCRKNKKVKSSRLSCDNSNNHSGCSSSELGVGGGLKFLHGLSLSPSVDFHHLGNGGLPFPRLQTTPIFNQFSSFGDTSSVPVTTASSFDPSSGTTNSLAALNYPFSTGYNGAIQGMSSMNINHSHTNLASSIESLSSMNQDLHWKLQQQRLAMLFGGENQKDNNNNNSVSQVVGNLVENQILQKPQPILFQNLEVTKPAGNGIFSVGNSRKEGGGECDTATEWFFGNSYGSSVTPTPTASSGGHDNGSNWNSGGGVHAWGDLQQQQQYSALP